MKDLSGLNSLRSVLISCFTVGIMICAAAINSFAAPTPATALLALNKGDRTLAIIDPGTMERVAEVPAGDNIHEVVASADGRLAFVSNYGAGHTLSVVDLTAQKALPPVELGALRSPHGLDEAGGKIYFTAESSRIIGRYDPESQKVDWLFGLGQNRTHMISVSRAGTIYTANVNSDSISILEPGSGRSGNDWNVMNVHVGSGPEGFDLSPDGRELWAANSHDGTVSIIDLAKKTAVQTVNVGTKVSNRLKFTPNGQTILISDLNGNDLVVMDAVARKEIKRIRLGGGAAGILIQPDGARAYVSVGFENAVTVIDLKKLEITGRIQTGRGPDGLAWAVRK